MISAQTQFPGTVDRFKLVIAHFGTYKNGSPLADGRVYNPDADLDKDGRINGEDHITASYDNERDVYDFEDFEYDRNGNRTKLVQNGDEYQYTYGPRNRLETIKLKKEGSKLLEDFAKYEYDANGNTIKRTIYGESGTSVIEFEYDTLNRLVKTTKNGSEITGYFYDNAGNRLIKKTAGQTTLYLRHGQIAVAMDLEVYESDPDNKGLINRYVLSGDLLAGRVTTIVKNDSSKVTENFYYHLDHLNSTKCVTKQDGTVEVLYEYRAFGEQLKRLDKDGNDTTDKAKYSYSGKELDTATNLYYFNARYYDPTIGRFINVDPLQDGQNWYIYCSNNPLCFVDPTGLKDEGIFNKTKDFVEGVADQTKDYLNNEVLPKVDKAIREFEGTDEKKEMDKELNKSIMGQIIGTLDDFASEYIKSKVESNNGIANDHFHHANANSKAAQRGIIGEIAAIIISATREAYDHYSKKEQPLGDNIADNQANQYGRQIENGVNPDEHNQRFDVTNGGSRLKSPKEEKYEEKKVNPLRFINEVFIKKHPMIHE